MHLGWTARCPVCGADCTGMNPAAARCEHDESFVADVPWRDVYDSARHRGGECLAAFHPDVVAPCVQAQHLVYRWDGGRIAKVLEVSEMKRSGS